MLLARSVLATILSHGGGFETANSHSQYNHWQKSDVTVGI